jgi:hypothetical protein
MKRLVLITLLLASPAWAGKLEGASGYPPGWPDEQTFKTLSVWVSAWNGGIGKAHLGCAKYRRHELWTKHSGDGYVFFGIGPEWMVELFQPISYRLRHSKFTHNMKVVSFDADVFVKDYPPEKLHGSVISYANGRIGLIKFREDETIENANTTDKVFIQCSEHTLQQFMLGDAPAD